MADERPWAFDRRLQANRRGEGDGAGTTGHQSMRATQFEDRHFRSEPQRLDFVLRGVSLPPDGVIRGEIAC